MKGRGGIFATLSLLAGLLVGVLAGDIVEEIRGNFQMGLFGRQQPSLTNFQRFTEGMGGKLAAQIVANDESDADQRPFKIVGGRSNDETFLSMSISTRLLTVEQPGFQDAVNRACDDQKNDCADLSNNGGADFKVSDCDAQNNQCKSINQPSEQDDQFMYFCD
ncbi:hypothetical protein AAE478_008765 [Parahypoxylon ruwenzoriense]